MTVLVTGFTPFFETPFNPTAAIADILRTQPDALCSAEVLPTEYAAAEFRIRLLLEKRPSACICLGVAAAATAVRIERYAYNVDDSDAPDNVGVVRQGVPIREGGPEIMTSTLPVEALYGELIGRGIPVSWSNDPGRFICNHVFYSALDFIERNRLPIQCGLIHLPMNAEATAGGTPGLPFEQLLEAVNACINVIHRELSYRSRVTGAPAASE